MQPGERSVWVGGRLYAWRMEQPTLQPLDSSVPQAERPSDSSVSVDTSDWSEQIKASLQHEDALALHRLLEPTLRRLAGEEWELRVVNKSLAACCASEKWVQLGLKLKKHLDLDTRAALTELVFFHELGHALYTTTEADFDQCQSFAAKSTSNNPNRIAAEFECLDFTFSDARLRSRLLIAMPERTYAMELDRELAVETRLAEYCARYSHERSTDATCDFVALPEGEQVDLLMLAHLNAHVYEAGWEAAAPASVMACFGLLKPHLDLVRDGTGDEYVTELSACYGILSQHEVDLSSCICSYSSVLSEYFCEYIANVLATLRREFVRVPIKEEVGLTSDIEERMLEGSGAVVAGGCEKLLRSSSASLEPALSL